MSTKEHSLVKGVITILGDENKVNIEILDKNSNTLISKVELTPNEFCSAALGRLARLYCDVEVGNLDRIGKKVICKKFEFPFLDGDFDNRKDIAKELIIKNCPNGWVPDLYFGSQDSFFYKEGKPWVRCTIRKWVDKNERG